MLTSARVKGKSLIIHEKRRKKAKQKQWSFSWPCVSYILGFICIETRGQGNTIREHFINLDSFALHLICIYCCHEVAFYYMLGWWYCCLTARRVSVSKKGHSSRAANALGWQNERKYYDAGIKVTQRFLLSQIDISCGPNTATPLQNAAMCKYLWKLKLCQTKKI
jgi:hypothetical protein